MMNIKKKERNEWWKEAKVKFEERKKYLNQFTIVDFILSLPTTKSNMYMLVCVCVH